MDYTDKFYKHSQGEFHYLDNGKDSNNLVVIFPPGIYDARFVKDLDLKIDSRMICLSYPSRYKSSVLNTGNDVNNISLITSDLLTDFLRSNNFKSVTFLGFSYGTAIISKVCELLPSLEKIDKVVLVNPGEFFTKTQKNLLRKIFKPATYSKFYSNILKLLVTNILRAFEGMYFPKTRLGMINQQWLSILDYNIDLESIITKPTVIIKASKDHIIDPKSIEKVLSKYPNNSVKVYEGNHISKYNPNTDYRLIKDWIFDELAA